MKVSNLVPEVYYKESRDFSYVGRLFEIVFNYMKSGVDLINLNLLNQNINSSALQLLSYTLGFETKHEYNTKNLISILSVFTELLKNKGTQYAIEKAVQTLLNSQNIASKADITIIKNNIDLNESYKINIYVPSNIKDLILLEDLFNYILPAGWVYEFILIQYNNSQTETEIKVDSKELENVKISNNNLTQVVTGIKEVGKDNTILNLNNINTIGSAITPINTTYTEYEENNSGE